MHALIGPNDSGKSAILRALAEICEVEIVRLPAQRHLDVWGSTQVSSDLKLLLLEEPENGLHPCRIREVMHQLRKISERTQIVLATHSPLVINELQPEEVTIVTRTPERGTICTPMTQTKNFRERAKVYALGELWLSYADGELEEELVGEDPEAAKS